MINRVHGGDCLKQGIIDFSANINPLGLPKGLNRAISKNMNLILRYPDPSSEQFKMKLAAFHQVGMKNIAVGNGSIELIYLVPRAFNIKRALIITPTFSEYEYAARSAGSRPIFFNTFERKDFRVDCVELAKRLPYCDALFLCNPNNPTGSMLGSDEVLYLSRLCEKLKKILVLDEAFIEFTDESKKKDILLEAVKKGSLVVLRSMTKFFAMPGLRLGYAIAHEKMIKKILDLQYPWNVNGLAQFAGEEVLADKNYIGQTRLFVDRERRYMFKALSGIKGLKVYPSSANFLLCKLQSTSIRNSRELALQLSHDNIHIRHCGNFRGLNDKFFRVAVRKRADNDLLIEGIKRSLR